jgi:squalene-hopene/tetraprenyl-beta-curcumene cyclase
MHRRDCALAVVVSCCFATVARSALAQPASAPADVHAAIEKGLEFLRTRGQAEDGTFSIQAGPGLTALALTAAIRSGLPLDDPMVAKGLHALEGFVQDDGGIYGNGRLRNYETCVAILCFSAANADGRYSQVIADAQRFLRTLQIGPATGIDYTNPRYGGVGYGGPERPDLSNTSYLVDALMAAGADGDDDAIQRALTFVSRCQNLDSIFNDTKFAKLVGDGGFYYLIPAESVDPSSDSERYAPNGGLRSYGSMSYAGFKSLVYAGLTPSDSRVKAVVEWVGKNYSVTENPGVGSAGLFYYYHSMASALAAAKFDVVIDAAGVAHDWRSELAAELARRQNADGSWTNSNRQWFENDPNLATAFALMALDYCRPSAGATEAPPAAP